MRKSKTLPALLGLILGAASLACGQYSGEMITIPAGNFLMGNDGGSGYGTDFEGPQRPVNVAAYRIGKYEVTRGEYQKFIDAGGYTTQSYWSTAGWAWRTANKRPLYWTATQTWVGHGMASPTFTQTANHPVIGVCLYEAQAFCKWAGGTVPTEAQWEKAAAWDEAAQHARYWPWGDTWDAEKCNNMDDHSSAAGGYFVYQSAPVGSYPAGASAYGCMDMVGNAWEITSEGYIRGGSLDDDVSASVRNHYRLNGVGFEAPDFQGWTIASAGDCDAFGFRVAMPATSTSAEKTEASGALRFNAFPNPSTGKTSIIFNLPQASRAEIAVYNSRGQSMAHFGSAAYPGGSHSVVWDAARQPNGVYFAILKAKGKTYQQKILLCK